MGVRFAEFVNKYRGKIYLAILIIAAGVLRFINLGYSNFQGDEIRALFKVDFSQPTLKALDSCIEFLLAQRRGPIQFLVTLSTKWISQNYQNEMVVRIPFAIAGFLSVIVFYLIVKKLFNSRTGIFSALLIAANGFFVAFSRIVQYQSFLILFTLLAIYMLILSIKDDRWKIKGIYLSFISWTLAILTHYDGIFIAPVMGVLLFQWIKINWKTNKKHLLIAITIFILIISAFYTALAFNISERTKNYLERRFSGSDKKISNTLYTFTLYNPLLVKQIYLVLIVFGIFTVFIKREIKYYLILLWFLFPFIVMEFIIKNPGTHIYNYILPLTILCGIGLNFMVSQIPRLHKFRYMLHIKILSYVTLTVFFTFFFLQSYNILIDHNPEYPWNTKKKFLLWRIKMPHNYGKYNRWIFGFPYNRKWSETRNFFENIPNNKTYSSNEKAPITQHYINLKRKNKNYEYFIYVKNPQTWNIMDESRANWLNKQKLLFESRNDNGESVVKIYKINK